jgi:YrbI family 3-deoxy-D-manno-octulosonate 8-phosphate phosphatase
MEKKLQEKLKKIRLLALDFDGVMTDGFVLLDEHGREYVRCSRKDGMGINLLKKAGIKVIVISTEKNPVVSERCKKLAIPCVQGIESSKGKRDILINYIEKEKLMARQVAYMGDDINDIDSLMVAGVALTVADANPLVKKMCDYITVRLGGMHAVREVCDLILQAQT